MGLFSALTKTGDNRQHATAANSTAMPELPMLAMGSTQDTSPPRRTGRTSVYAVRVSENFKGEMLTLQAELQLERHEVMGKAKRITEGEIIEKMLEVFKAARRSSSPIGNAVPLAKDVWQGVDAIARRLGISPAAVVEQLVVQKVAELGLLPRRT